MKKITLLLMLFVGMLSYGQIWSIASCSTELGSNTYGPMYSVGTANSTSRSAVIYPSTQLTSVANKVLTSAYFKRFTASGTMLGTPNLKIYLKETTSTSWGSAAIDWTTSIAGATLVYDSNPVSALGTTAGWKSFDFSTNFSYSGTQNLAIFFEYSNTSASNSITYVYEYTNSCINTSDSNTTKYSNNTTGILAPTLGSTDYRRPLIGFDYDVACNAPTGLTVTAVGTTTADISWTASTTNPSLGYDYYLSTSPTEPTAATVATGNVPTGTTKNLTGLNNSTAYYVWVRSNCGTGDLSAWKASSFVTQCVAISSFPWTENFDTMTTIGANVLPNLCWRSLGGGSANTAQFTTSNAASQTYNDPRSAPNYVTIYYPTTNAAYLYTPAMELTAGQSYDFSFYYIGDNKAGWDGQVVYNSIQSATGATVLGASYVVSATTTSQTNYVKVTRTFVPTTTGTYYFGIKAISVTTAPFYLGFDDFKVELSPTCINPTALTATNITSNSATVSWTASTTVPALGYEYYISATNTAPTAATPGIAVASGTSVNLTNLPSNEARYVWVRSLCSATDISSWSDPVSFTTACSSSAVPSTPEGFEVTTDLPNCWSTELISGTTNWAVFAPTGSGDITTSHSGTKVIYKPYSNSDALLFSTPFNYSAITTATRVNVWLYRNSAAAAADRYRFFVNTSKSLTGATQIFELFLKTTVAPTVTTTGWYNYTFDIPASVNGQSMVYVIVQATTSNSFSSYALGMDDFKIESTLSAPSFNTADFKAYPNPVKNFLNLSYTQDISDVAVFNLLGQQVLTKKVNATESQIDMSNLSQGTYLVKVTVGDQVKTVKVMKQ